MVPKISDPNIYIKNKKIYSHSCFQNREFINFNDNR